MGALYCLQGGATRLAARGLLHYGITTIDSAKTNVTMRFGVRGGAGTCDPLFGAPPYAHMPQASLKRPQIPF